MEKMSNITFIILAAGKSSRMGIHKGLLKIRAMPLLLDHVECSTQSSKIIITASSAYSDYKKLLDTSGPTRNIELIYNPHPERGQFYSLQLALQQLEADNEYTFVTPIDKIPASKETQNIMISMFQRKNLVIIPKYKGKCGHPVLLHKNFYSKLSSLHYKQPEARLDYQINGVGSDLRTLVEVKESSISQNFNCPEDL